MTPNNNLSILPFYDSVEKQNHRKDYAQGNVFCLATPDRKILPFQFLVPHSAASSFSVILRGLNSSFILDISSEIIETGLYAHENLVTGYDAIIYHGKLPMPITTPEGQYYLELTYGGQTYYSEVYTTVRSVEGYLKISYSDNQNLQYPAGAISYEGGFNFEVYLPTQLGRPEYPFEEQVEKRDGYTFIEKQISEKTFKFDFLAPEYLLDAMRIIRMSDNIEITNRGDSYTADSFLITPTWQEGGYLAKVEAEFQCDTVLKKVGNIFTEVGDFNNDFNDDFNK